MRPKRSLMIQVNFFLLIIAGNETTRNALSGGIQALCENPDQFERLRREPALAVGTDGPPRPIVIAV